MSYSKELIDLLQGMYTGKYSSPTGLEPLITDPDYTGGVPNPVVVETSDGNYYQPQGVDGLELLENPDFYSAASPGLHIADTSKVHPDFEEEFGYQPLPPPNPEGILSGRIADREYASLGPKDGVMSWRTSGSHMPVPPAMEQSGNGWSNVNSETVPLNLPNPNELLTKLQGSASNLGRNIKPLVPRTLGLGLSTLAAPKVVPVSRPAPRPVPRQKVNNRRNNVYMGGLPPHMREIRNGVYMGGLPPHMRG